MSDPKGGKVCWPEPLPAAATVYRVWIPAREMQPAGSGFSAATELQYDFGNGFIRDVLRFRPVKLDTAVFDFAVPESIGQISDSRISVYWFGDGIDPADVNWQLYGNARDPGVSISSTLATLSVASTPAGDEKLNRAVFAVAYTDPVNPDDYYTGLIQRDLDLNGDNAWLLGIEILLKVV